MLEMAIIGLMLMLEILGTPAKSKEIENELSEIEFTDKKGCPPTLISKTRDKNGWVYEFYSPRLPLYQYENHSEDIENALDIKIISIEFGKSIRHVIIKAIDYARKPLETIMWNDTYFSPSDFILKLGESYFGDESFDLSVTPHVLIGGGSGSGKSKLLKLVLMQCIKKGAVIYLADFKGGVDYPKIWHDKCFIIVEADIRRFYNYLIDEKCLKIATVDNVHTVLHQVLDIAVEDGYLRNNIGDNALKELKQTRNLFTEKRKALTVAEQDIFLDFLATSNMYKHWYPIFALMLGTGLRVGEATGLRWDDVDFEITILV